MKRVIDGTGAGDPRFIIDKERADALIPDNPGWESEGAYRHHEHPDAEESEVESAQRIPAPLDEVLEEPGQPELNYETLPFRESTRHDLEGD